MPERPVERYIDIRVTFKETIDDGLVPVSIRRQARHNLGSYDMRDSVEEIWESNDVNDFVNGLMAALHGEETAF